MITLSRIAFVPVFVVIGVVGATGCADEEQEEEGQSYSALNRCPSPTKDKDAFIACVLQKTGGSPSGQAGQAGQTGQAGKSGTATSSQNGGTISIGGVSSKNGCSSLSISCKSVNGQNSCTCRGNGGPEQSCDGTNCQQVCCP